MDPAKRKKLDQILRRRRLKVGLRMIAVLIPALAFIAFFTFDPPRDGEILEAEVVRLWQPPMKWIYRPTRWVVELENGVRVSAGGTAHLPFEKGRKVLVRERIGRVWGKVGYVFHGYAEAANREN